MTVLQRLRSRCVAWPILIVAIAFGLIGVGYFGYASAEHYGWVLRCWLVMSAISTVLLAVIIAKGPQTPRIVALACLAALAFFSIEPAERLLNLGLSAP